MSEAAAETTEAPAPAPPLASGEKGALTDYLVLSKEAGFWTEQTVVSARSAKAAITAYVKDQKATEGTFVAVPARSWQPATLKIETQTKINLT